MRFQSNARTLCGLAWACLLLAPGCDLGGTQATLEHTQGTTQTCERDQDCDDDNSCTADVCVQARCGHTPFPDRTPCDDGLYCTQTDTCQAGACTGPDRDCGDLTNACNEGVCSEEQDRCAALPLPDDTECSDGLWCTGGDDQADTCQAGQCVPAPGPCDDLDPCTRDTCVEAGRTCEHLLQPSPGLEGLEVAGTCQNGLDDDCDDLLDGQDPDCIVCDQDGDCEDFNPCTEDACLGQSCQNQAYADGTGCDDGLYCTDPDSCLGGVCQGPRTCAYLDSECSVGACEEDPPGCVPHHVPGGTPCEDGAYCTSGDFCSGGACQPGLALPCEDDDVCTRESCDELAERCQSTLEPRPNQEGLNLAGTCANGLDDDCDRSVDLADPDCLQCEADPQCDDGDTCTDDVCEANTCTHLPGTPGAMCDDGLRCTIADSCRDAGGGNLSCRGDPRSCDDGDACTRDSCGEANPDDGCDHVFDPTGLTEGWMGDAVCTDGADQDCDGWTDAADPACLTCEGARGSTAAGQTLSISGEQAARFVQADFDRDHIVDLAVLAEDPVVLRVYLGQGSLGHGDGTFSLGNQYAMAGGVDLAVVDYDRDGKLDLYVLGVSWLQALRGLGNGSFTQGAVASAEDGAARLAVADLDLDLIPDAAVTFPGSGEVHVFLAEGTGGRGAGTFLAPLQFSAGSGASAIAAAPLDGDSVPDLAVGRSGSPEVVVLRTRLELYPGDLTFDQDAFPACGSFPGVRELVAGRFDGDGAMDLAVACDWKIDPGPLVKVHTLLGGRGADGLPDGSFATSGAALVLAGVLSSLAAADLDGQGTLDLLASHHTSPAGGPLGLALCPGQGTGAFDAPSIESVDPTGAPSMWSQVGVAELNGDGLPDVQVLLDYMSSSVFLRLGQGRGGVGSGHLAPLPVPQGVVDLPEGALVADLDGDGVQDVAAVGADELVVFAGLGEGGRSTGTFSPGVAHELPATCLQPVGLAGADVDRDGDLDLAVACHGALPVGLVALLLNDGAGGFTEGPDVPTLPNARELVLADLDHGGGPDLVVASDATLGQQVAVHLNQGDGTFGSGSPYATGQPALDSGQPADVAVADLDADGLPDLVVANRGVENDPGSDPDDVAVLLGQRTAEGRPAGTFGPPATTSVCNEPVALAVADFNQDGAQDVAVGCRNDYTCALKLLRGGLAGGFPTGALSDATPAGCLGFTDGLDAYGLAAADLTGDGWPELVTVGNASDHLRVLRNRASGLAFEVPQDDDLAELLGCDGPAAVAVGQVNPDGIPDAAVSCHHSQGLLVLAGTGTCSASP
ncbi:MAG TPA: VCBS repeat-containing protein [Myxococcota bacterium]|nr:VCBS repeat-containing protein [Myxococcota bacterium]HRY93953.1 VCBS repeat-containing protein [Myxococcota bacterium]